MTPPGQLGPARVDRSDPERSREGIDMDVPPDGPAHQPTPTDPAADDKAIGARLRTHAAEDERPARLDHDPCR